MGVRFNWLRVILAFISYYLCNSCSFMIIIVVVWEKHGYIKIFERTKDDHAPFINVVSLFLFWMGKLYPSFPSLCQSHFLNPIYNHITPTAIHQFLKWSSFREKITSDKFSYLNYWVHLEKRDPAFKKILIAKTINKKARILCYRLRDHKYAAITFKTWVKGCQYIC